MRFLDRIMANGTWSSDDLSLANGTLMDDLQKAQLVVIDNVADYYYQTTGQPKEYKADLKATDFPNVMLPFKNGFLETRIRVGSPWFPPGSFDEFGLLMKMHEAEEFKENLPQNYSQTHIREAGVFFDNPKIARVLYSRLFLGYRSQHKVVHFANFVVPVDSEGRILESKSENTWVHAALIRGKDLGVDNPEKMLRAFAVLCLPPVLLALSFMHCRNVKVLSENPPPKLSKKYQKKTGRPLLRYRVLQIDHMKQVLEREGGISQNGLKKALHICRGHFARYGQEGKGLLFGKHAATVWVPMHSRGSAREGVVVKDYEVK